jgi:hypothetical protein
MGFRLFFEKTKTKNGFNKLTMGQTKNNVDYLSIDGG